MLIKTRREVFAQTEMSHPLRVLGPELFAYAPYVGAYVPYVNVWRSIYWNRSVDQMIRRGKASSGVQ
jgi:uncharacterized protein YfaP (DUF2135 family)